MKMKLIVMCFIFIFAASACDKPVEQRKYKEIFTKPDITAKSMSDGSKMPFNNMPNDDIHANLRLDSTEPMNVNKDILNSVDSSPLAWETPVGWVEEKGAGMRVATFRNTDPNLPIETTIVSLGGSAGGLSANVVRWLQQMGLKIPEAKELELFIQKQQNFQTISGLNVVLIDFTELQPESSSESASMITGIIENNNSQIFVKMKGSKAAILQNRGHFKELLQSIHSSN